MPKITKEPLSPLAQEINKLVEKNPRTGNPVLPDILTREKTPAEIEKEKLAVKRTDC